MMGASLFPEAVTRKLLQYYQIRQTDSSVLTRRFSSFGRTVDGTRDAIRVSAMFSFWRALFCLSQDEKPNVLYVFQQDCH